MQDAGGVERGEGCQVVERNPTSRLYDLYPNCGLSPLPLGWERVVLRRFRLQRFKSTGFFFQAKI